MRVLITGASGTLGQDLVKQYLAEGDEVLATDRKQLDITNADHVERVLARERPDLLLNAAAYNFVDAVEDNSVYPLAEAINAHGPANLARAAAQLNIPFAHFSTDYVFSGTKKEGYSEEDLPDPISAYGRTKAMGEEAVQTSGGTWYVFRLSKIFGTPGLTDQSKPSFVHLMMKLARQQPELKIVDEEVGCPSYTKDIAQAVSMLLRQPLACGIYHLVNDGPGVTWYAFARELFELAGMTTPFVPVSADIFAPRPAQRPKFAQLLNTKLPPLRPRLSALREFLETEQL